MNRVEIQKWSDRNRYLIINKHGSVQVDIVKETFSENSWNATASVFSLWVETESRQEGIGTSLLDTAEECVRKEGYNKVYLIYDSNDAPRWVFEWYERRGYSEIITKNSQTLMVKNLQESFNMSEIPTGSSCYQVSP